MILATGFEDKFPDAPLRVSFAAGILWREALVIVVVAIDDNIRASVVERDEDGNGETRRPNGS